MLLGAGGLIAVYLAFQTRSAHLVLMLTAWIMVPAIVIAEATVAWSVRRPARLLEVAAAKGFDVTLRPPRGATIGPVDRIWGDGTGSPSPTLKIDESSEPPLLIAAGSYRNPRYTGVYREEVPVAREALNTVRAWVNGMNARRL